MKECRHCHNLYNDDLNNCPNCGSPSIITEEEKNAEAAKIEEERNKDYYKNSKKLRNLIIIVICAAVIIIIAVAAGINAENNREYTYQLENGETIIATTLDIKEFIRLGDEYFNEGNYAGALDEYRKVPKDYKDYELVAAKIEKAESAYAEQAIAQADGLLNEERYPDALQPINEAALYMPLNQELDNKKSQIEDAYIKVYLDGADDALQNGNFKKAVSIMDEAANIFTDNSSLTQKRNEILGKYKEDFIENITSLIKEKDYEEASAALTTARDILGENTEFDDLEIELNKSITADKLAELDSEGNIEGAISYLSDQLPALDNDPEYMKKLNVYKTQYKDQALAQAQTALIAEGYESAVNILKNTETVLGSDVDIETKITEYEGYAPVYLTDLDTFYEGGLSEQEIVLNDLTDNIGNKHGTGIRLEIFGMNWAVNNNVFREYILEDQKYDFVEGLFALTYDSKDRNPESYWAILRIYGDDNLIYESPAVSSGVEPVHFKVDISQYHKISFGLEHILWNHANPTEWALLDTILYKEPPQS